MLPFAASLIMLVGSYGNADTPTFRTFSFDLETGRIEAIDSIALLSNPSFLAVADTG